MENVRFRVYNRYVGKLNYINLVQPELNGKVICKANLHTYCTDAGGRRLKFGMWVMNPSGDTGEFDRLLDDIRAKTKEIVETSDTWEDIVWKVKERAVFNRCNEIVGIR